MVEENYDDDQHLDAIRKKIFQKNDAALKHLADENKESKDGSEQHK